MKLYTEEQVAKMLGRARLHNQDDSEMFTDEYLISCETSIELPSDEEIKKEMEYDEFDPYDVAYFGGLSYMRDLIQGGNNE